MQSDSRQTSAIPGLTAEQIRRIIRMLAIPSAVSVGMILGRFAYVGDARFRFCGLLLNLLLAWIPMGFALLIWRLSQTKRLTPYWLFIAWLLFFPNAFYITTDLIHTQKFGTDGVFRWYDILMTGCFAASGMFLGSASLLLLHSIVRYRFGKNVGWLFAGGILALGSFGIYLGRFLRLNSWDIVTRPHVLVDKILAMPAEGAEIATFCGAFFLFSVLVYSFVFSTAHLYEQSRPHA